MVAWTGVQVPWLLQYMVILLPFAMSMVSIVDSDSRKLPPIYWNSSNPMFKQNNTVIPIRINDAIDIICPLFSDTDDESLYEYYNLYFVSEKEYNECIIYKYTAPAISVLNCTRPREETRFTMWIEEFNPFPNTIDFKVGTKYYLITTSTGSKCCLQNQDSGACKKRNMRLILDLSNDSSSVTPHPSTGQTKPTRKTTTRITSTTQKSTTTTKTTTLPPTTKRPITTTTLSTRLPDGTPRDTNIVIDATGGQKNVGTISSARTLRHSFTSIYVTLTLVTFILLVR